MREQISGDIPVVQLDKPPKGAPCNGCGYCCIEEVCQLGRELGDEVHCKALIAGADGRYACGLVVDPYRYLPPERLARWQKIDRLHPGLGEQTLKDYHAEALGAGRGCDSVDP
ncbi:hypothetical protein [Geopseudomonas aromaticivorans]